MKPFASIRSRGLIEKSMFRRVEDYSPRAVWLLFQLLKRGKNVVQFFPLLFLKVQITCATVFRIVRSLEGSHAKPVQAFSRCSRCWNIF